MIIHFQYYFKENYLAISIFRKPASTDLVNILLDKFSGSLMTANFQYHNFQGISKEKCQLHYFFRIPQIFYLKSLKKEWIKNQLHFLYKSFLIAQFLVVNLFQHKLNKHCSPTKGFQLTLPRVAMVYKEIKTEGCSFGSTLGKVTFTIRYFAFD